MLFFPWIRPTWVPCGALGLLLVNALPLPATPAEAVNVQGDPPGLYCHAADPVPRGGSSNPGSRMLATKLTCTWSMKAVLSPPLGLSPLNVMVWKPAVTVKLLVVKTA